MDCPTGIPQHPGRLFRDSRRREATPGTFASFVGTKEDYLLLCNRKVRIKAFNKTRERNFMVGRS